ncbi:DUF4194 domain-containing protein [Erythrobacter aureus]|uniref:DUF4194 domain-containing protein n=1 Tax=Erythrobacter aureus TaxID=2182384 RepID=A0A345YJC9_9SPHN|nr:DUF4194 domain-containing protein [Erythrobacter aureus]AXK44031.1 DUF4194 domain-containing protein [Erythrobacter aureus]
MPMLFDLEDLLTRPKNQDVEASEFRAAASRMLTQQTLFRDDWNSKNLYEFILRFRVYFSDLFDALGLEMVISERDLTIVLKPAESQAKKRLPMDETVILLSLREAFERGVTSFDIGDFGEVEITSMALLERYEAVTGKQRPAWTRVHAILKEIKRRRIIDFGEEFPEESGVSIIVRPSIREITGEGYLTRIEDFIAAQSPAEVLTSTDREERATDKESLTVAAEDEPVAENDSAIPEQLPEAEPTEELPE